MNNWNLSLFFFKKIIPFAILSKKKKESKAGREEGSFPDEFYHSKNPHIDTLTPSS